MTFFYTLLFSLAFFSYYLYQHRTDIFSSIEIEEEITSINLTIQTVMQEPELPNGCEITSLTAVLNYYGYQVSKTTMADNYLPQSHFYRKNNRLYGADPYQSFAGNPRDKASGFFVYAPPIVYAANKFVQKKNGSHKAIDISGSSQERIISQLAKGTPIVIWVTLDLSKPQLDYSWYLQETNEEFIAPVNLHAVVLTGFDEEYVYVMDPLKGHRQHEREVFFESYYDLGSHAVVVVENQ